MILCREVEVHYCCLKSYGVFYFSNVWWEHKYYSRCELLGGGGEKENTLFYQHSVIYSM